MKTISIAFLLISCNKKLSETTFNNSVCNDLIELLSPNDNLDELKWLQSNEGQCMKMMSFIEGKKFSKDSKNYMNRFLRMKLKNDKLVLDRFIELYNKVESDPNGLLKIK